MTAEILEGLNAVNKAIGIPQVTEHAAKSGDVNTTTSLSAGGQFMNRKLVHGLILDAAQNSAWLGATSTKVVDRSSGEFTGIDMDDWVLEPHTEGESQTASNLATTNVRNYVVKAYHGTIFWTKEDVREAAASGESDFTGKLRRLVTLKLGSAIAQLCINGDTSLAQNGSRERRFLANADGWLKQIRAEGNVATTTRGSPYSIDAFGAAMDLLPERYQNDPNLRWLVSPMLQSNVTQAFATQWAQASQLAQEALVSRNLAPPLGIPGLQVPQMPRNQGFATLNGSAVAGDAVTNPSGTIIKIRVDTLLGGASASNAGRKIKITRNNTGLSETVSATWDGTNNFASTVGALGQSVISTTASDYTLDVADCASILLTNPRNLVNIVYSEGFSIDTMWQQDARRYRADFYIDMCPLVYRPDAASLQDGIIVAPKSFGS